MIYTDEELTAQFNAMKADIAAGGSGCFVKVGNNAGGRSVRQDIKNLKARFDKVAQAFKDAGFIDERDIEDIALNFPGAPGPIGGRGPPKIRLDDPAWRYCGEMGDHIEDLEKPTLEGKLHIPRPPSVTLIESNRYTGKTDSLKYNPRKD